jgi:competence protein ComEC
MSKQKEKILWKQAPFLRLLIPLVMGILTENYFPVRIFFLWTVFALTIILLAFCNRHSLKKSFNYILIAGISIQLAFFSLGRILESCHRDIQVDQIPGSEKSEFLIVQLLNDPVQKNKSKKCIGRILLTCKRHICFKENEKILLFFKTKINPQNISAGTVIVIKKDLRPIENFKSFPDFNYVRYCELRHIYGQVFLNQNQFAIIGFEYKNSFLLFGEELRTRLLDIIKTRITSRSEKSFLEALMLGFTEDLDPALLKSYADSGVIHIIAISGLHLALIFQILQQMLRAFPEKKKTRWIKLFLILTVLWGYSFLSGASPSVVRSALMFSFVLCSKNIFREVSLFNTLAGSAFLLLCFDPGWIWDIGFQLSYAAVLSLRLFSKPIREIVFPRNKVLIYLWDAISISVAAQILTTPVSIFYFHRFPCYFLIANLLAVPLSSLILIGGILLFFFSFNGPVAQFLGNLLGMLIRLLNDYIVYVSRLPGAVWRELYPSISEMIVTYVILFCLYWLLKNKTTNWLIACLTAICLFECLRLIS